MTKKLGLIISMALVAVVVATTVILGVVKKDYSPSVQTNYQSVLITNSNNTNFNFSVGKLDENKEDYNKIVELYNNSFKQSVLASFFGGNMSNDIKVVYTSGSVPKSVSGYKIEWTLNAEGEKIVDNFDAEQLVNKLTIGVEDSAGFKTVVIYASLKDSSRNAYLTITTKANFETLYDFLEGLNA